MQKSEYNYRVLYKVAGEDEWRVLTPTTGVSKVYTRIQDTKALIRAQDSCTYERDGFGSWKRVTVEIEYKIQRRPVGGWEDCE